MHPDWMKVMFSWLQRNTELAQAVDIMMCCWHEQREFDDQSALVDFPILLQYFLEEIQNKFSVFLSSYRNTCESLEKLKNAVETLA